MNLNQSSRILALALASATLFATLGGFQAAFASQAAVPETFRATGSERVESLSSQPAHGNWTCPMHPEIHSHEAGRCPICKMQLVKAQPKNV